MKKNSFAISLNMIFRHMMQESLRNPDICPLLFEEVAKLCGSPKKAANWFMGEVLRLTKDKGLDVEKVSFTPEHLADLIQMVEKERSQRTECKESF